MIKQSHFWVFIQKKQNQNIEEISALSYSLQHYSQIAKTQKQPKCPSTDELIKMWRISIYTEVYYLAMRKKKILPFAKKNMDGP